MVGNSVLPPSQNDPAREASGATCNFSKKTPRVALWTALITPFSDDGARVDFDALAILLRRQELAGNGVLILGSTGESLSLSEGEKQEILRFTLAQKLRVPVMVGTPNIQQEQTLRWLDFCAGRGVDAYLAATPLYSKPAASGQVDWFARVFDAADAPVMLYNIPSRVGAALAPQVLHELKDHPRFWAVKEASGGVEATVDFALAAPCVEIFCGDDALLPSVAPLGSCGLVSVASNMWPQSCRSYVEACLAGTYRGTAWWRISKALFSTTSPVPVKALMHHRGVIASPCVRPPLSLRDLSGLSALEEADQAVRLWRSALRPRFPLPSPVAAHAAVG